METLKLHYPGKNIEKKHIYVALNLMTLSNIQTFHNSRNIYWIDGLMGKLYCRLYGIKVNKFPGRDFLKEFLMLIHYSRQIKINPLYLRLTSFLKHEIVFICIKFFYETSFVKSSACFLMPLST